MTSYTKRSEVLMSEDMRNGADLAAARRGLNFSEYLRWLVLTDLIGLFGDAWISHSEERADPQAQVKH